MPRRSLKPTISDLTDGERLVLVRRRSRDGRGMSQAKFGKLIGTTRHQVQGMELDQLPLRDKAAEVARLVKADNLTLAERCFLARRRRGWNLTRMAHHLGFSRFWLAEMEHGRANCDTYAERMGL